MSVPFKEDPQFEATVECEHPNENLHSFEGRIHVNNRTEPLSMLNMAPRGSVLRNTDWAYGLVIYTGKNTKIMKNLKESVQKQSKLDSDLNRLVIAAFIVNMVILAISILLEYQHYKWAVDLEKELRAAGVVNYAAEWYQGPRNSNMSLHLLESVLSFFAMYTYVIPISLFVTMELVRLAQATYMQWDTKMKCDQVHADGKVKIVPMKASNSNLNEDLGRIDYIFSDKTGTFTQNLMRPAKWYVQRQALDEMKSPGAIKIAMQTHTDTVWNLYCRALAVCHGVIPAIDEQTNKMVYESQSPDETALLEGIKANGYELLSRNKNEMVIKINGVDQRFEILDVIEFDSTRKRMSVIIRAPEGIHLYCKGADNVMLERLGKNNDLAAIEHAKDTLVQFSNVGLRTLVICYRSLSDDEYTDFKIKYNAALVSLEGRDKKIAEAAKAVECDFEFLGCTAIEDKLQDQLPETIDFLLRVSLLTRPT